ncbi:MAG: alpha/beta hydrolase fold domain-containing protein [Acidobacteria bacterium]|nr:alpha/beta hydrolase fold domain-containing protein [Acidobacteriota bacterium]
MRSLLCVLAAALAVGAPLAAQRVEKDVAYASASPAQRLDLYLPDASGEALRPAIVFVHGGGWKGGDKGGGAWASLAREYSRAGYVAVSVNYRLLQEAPFPAQIADVKASVRWLRAHAAQYRIDPERIGAAGNSAGAHLVALLGLTADAPELEGDGPHRDLSSAVQAVCAAATPTDLEHWPGGPGPNARALLPGPPESLLERARRASPIAYVRRDAPPYLLIQGSADPTVPPSQSEAFFTALRAAGAPDVHLMLFAGADHGVLGAEKLLTHPAMRSFFDHALRR